MNLLLQWNDEANCRNVQFSVNYSIENSSVTIDSITPTKVDVLDKTGESVVKTMGVHTAKGQTMLTDQLKNSGQLNEFVAEIERRCGLLVESAS